MSEIESYLDQLFDRLAGQGAVGRRALAEAEDHLRAAAAEELTRGLSPDRAEHEAVRRFGPPAMVARGLRSSRGAGAVNRASSTGWLLASMAIAALAVSDLAAAGRLGWQSWSWACTPRPSPGCYYYPNHVLADLKSAVIAAAAGAVLLLGRWLMVRHSGLTPVRRGLVPTAGPLLALAAFGAGLIGWAPALPGIVFKDLQFMRAFPGRNIPLTIGAIVLVECMVAAVSLADHRLSRPSSAGQ